MVSIKSWWRFWPVLGALLIFLVPVYADAAVLDDQSQKCLQCHGNEDFSAEHDGEEISLYLDAGTLQDSVHGSNSCVTCHVQEKEFPHQDVVYGQELEDRVTENCVACHSEAAGYLNGAHAENGVSCFDCHGSGHQIEPVENSEMLIGKGVVETCTNCHQGVVAESYEESFHGKAVNLGSERAPTCVDCHGAHEVLGPENPESPVSEQNVAETCATCHKKAASGFSMGKEHFELSPEGDGKPMYYTFKFFTWLTIIVIALLIIHIELELFRKLKNAK